VQSDVHSSDAPQPAPTLRCDSSALMCVGAGDERTPGGVLGIEVACLLAGSLAAAAVDAVDDARAGGIGFACCEFGGTVLLDAGQIGTHGAAAGADGRSAG